jgi:anti-sigma factor RsiW
MPQLTCETFVDLLASYVDGVLDRGVGAEMRTHLAACAACRELLGSYRAVPTIVRKATHVTLPSGARHRLARRLAGRTTKTKT